MYGLVGLCYSAGGTYFVSTISTIEKRFKIPSRTTGNSSWSLYMTSSPFKIFINEVSGFSRGSLHWLNDDNDIFINCNWVVTRWHQNHLNHSSITQVKLNFQSAFIIKFILITNNLLLDFFKITT